ncbi:hypothetical protein F5Y16DRAFT_398532 [Xylariaceae sp. FL0255]|nr:hypothetical protein F5Y16DRAFT_398532 [Xylariaceae sp. FL0255]
MDAKHKSSSNCVADISTPPTCLQKDVGDGKSLKNSLKSHGLLLNSYRILIPLWNKLPWGWYMFITRLFRTIIDCPEPGQPHHNQATAFTDSVTRDNDEQSHNLEATQKRHAQCQELQEVKNLLGNLSATLGRMDDFITKKDQKLQEYDNKTENVLKDFMSAMREHPDFTHIIEDYDWGLEGPKSCFEAIKHACQEANLAYNGVSYDLGMQDERNSDLRTEINVLMHYELEAVRTDSSLYRVLYLKAQERINSLESMNVALAKPSLTRSTNHSRGTGASVTKHRESGKQSRLVIICVDLSDRNDLPLSRVIYKNALKIILEQIKEAKVAVVMHGCRGSHPIFVHPAETINYRVITLLDDDASGGLLDYLGCVKTVRNDVLENSSVFDRTVVLMIGGCLYDHQNRQALETEFLALKDANVSIATIKTGWIYEESDLLASFGYNVTTARWRMMLYDTYLSALPKFLERSSANDENGQT